VVVTGKATRLQVPMLSTENGFTCVVFNLNTFPVIIKIEIILIGWNGIKLHFMLKGRVVITGKATRLQVPMLSAENGFTCGVQFEC